MKPQDSDRYKRAVEKLLSLADFERKSRANQPPDWHLRRVERLMEMLGHPQLATPVVHVAGSKGKGSTCAMIASGLQNAGFQTGLYTSPHLHTFTERIQINGQNITRSQFADLIETLWPATNEIENKGDLGVVSVFEMLTAMAFVHFREHADIAVIETGLGGRLDATNVVQPEVAVITSISRDHVKILGDKISQIAREKAGIIKPNAPTVVAKNHRVPWRVIRERAAVVGSEVVGACETSKVVRIGTDLKTDFQQSFVMKRWRTPQNRIQRNDDDPTASLLQIPPDPGITDVTIRTNLLGTHQIDNARTAATTLNVLYRLRHKFDLNAAIQGIGSTCWPCRNEVLGVESWPLTILDGAHNDASLKALRNTVHQIIKRTDDTRYILIIGATEGHDHMAMARELAESAHTTIVTQSRHPKAVASARVAQAISRAGVECQQQLDVASALNSAREISQGLDQPGLIVVTGSLFIAAEAREHLLGIEPELYDDLPQPYMQPYVNA